mmetsp:Transcript_11791/g.25562  ORF Transcript_11791/g.25562 Transcript_11791/m.25562 type:complete len:205 (+) Transcript_11791:638-1252(+)
MRLEQLPSLFFAKRASKSNLNMIPNTEPILNLFSFALLLCKYLKVQVPLTTSHAIELPLVRVARTVRRDGLLLTFHHLFSNPLRVVSRVVLKVLLQRKQPIRMTVVMNITPLRDRHKRRSGPPFPITRRAPARHEPILKQLSHHLIHSTMILQCKLRQHVLALRLARVSVFALLHLLALQLLAHLFVRAEVGSAACGHLRHAEL